MNNHEEYIYTRYHLVPSEVFERALHDPLIYAAIRVWAEGEQSVDQLLIRLVLLLSSHADKQRETIKHMIATSSSPSFPRDRYD